MFDGLHIHHHGVNSPKFGRSHEPWSNFLKLLTIDFNQEIHKLGVAMCCWNMLLEFYLVDLFKFHYVPILKMLMLLQKHKGVLQNPPRRSTGNMSINVKKNRKKKPINVSVKIDQGKKY